MVRGDLSRCPYCGGPMLEHRSVTLKTPDDPLGALADSERPVSRLPALGIGPGRLAIVMLSAMAAGYLAAKLLAGR